MRSLREKRSETSKTSHNPEVSGSNPLPATNENRSPMGLRFFDPKGRLRSRLEGRWLRKITFAVGMLREEDFSMNRNPSGLLFLFVLTASSNTKPPKA